MERSRGLRQSCKTRKTQEIEIKNENPGWLIK